ncbi:hypothetical protein F3Y22_tig00110317pilonHSYRG00058 [Hibiscus syriacus]|uniref:DHHA2 domain-containing protein n=1 Tax=Hibiscus syriacus TaxID=106335 RepID=A0A6A3B7G4_HIBSY|nr:hypothetical protein F3Y22_tig00110317pilonHSYRG00058 [Hibiscus syriacus]
MKPYIHTQENAYSDGLLVDGALKDESSNYDFGRISNVQKVSRSTSEISDSGRKNLDLHISEKSMESLLDDSVSDAILQPCSRASKESWSNAVIPTASALPDIHSESGFQLGYPSDLMNDSLECSVPSLMRPVLEKSYKVMKKRASLSNIPLPQSAASFFTGHSTRMEIVESCENINRLNLFLKSKRDEVDAGVPGRFLHAVIGQDVPDVGSVASAIMYAYYLNETLGNDQFCTVPVINTKRAEFNSHAELKWLLDSSQIDQSSLIFIDEIDLSYYDLFGSLKLVLLNGSKLPSKQEALKESVIEIFNSKKAESVYPWVEKVTVGQECSSCTLIAETFAMTSPPILALQGFSRLLLAGILLDTGNLSSPDSTTKDKYMATLLLNGAGRFGCSGLYQILRYKLYDVSDLRVAEILGKDFKKWTRVGMYLHLNAPFGWPIGVPSTLPSKWSIGKQENVGSRMVSRVGMSSVGISVEQLLAHGDASTREIKHFQQMEKLRLLVIVSGYYDEQKNFKREILVSTESVEVMKKLLLFFNSNASQLPLKALHQQGLGDEMRAFEIDKVTSRKTIERLLEEFGGTSTNTNHHYVPSRPKQHHQHEWQ